MWRGNAGRSAVSAETLPDSLHLQWTRHLPPQVTAWKDEEVMKFDRSYQPVVLGGRMFVGSTVNDSLTAYDLETGAEQWRFYTEGPVRVSPAAWQDKVLVASDDGCLYCLGAADGKLRWRFRGAPGDRRLIGTERLISTWPARGGPVVADGTVYFAVGVWPFMGTFVHALDADSGRLLWTNDSTSFTWRRLPHPGSLSFSGLSPQGHLAAVGERLIVPGSRYLPAVFDRRTGEFLFYADGLGPEVTAQGQLALAGGDVFHLEKGYHVRLEGLPPARHCVLAPDAWYTPTAAWDAGGIRLSEDSIKVPESTAKGAPAWRKKILVGSIEKLWPLRGVPWLRAADRLVISLKGDMQMLDVSRRAAEPKVVWQASVAGTPSSVLAAGGRLIVVTLEGSIYCFGPKAAEPRTYELSRPVAAKSNAWSKQAAEILKATGATEGYCLVWGLRDGGLVEALVEQSKLHVIAVDSNPEKILALRRRLDAAGVYGTRAAALVGEPSAMSLAPYLASLIVSEDLKAAGFDKWDLFVERLVYPLRPYGGAACLPVPAEQQKEFDQRFARAKLSGAEIKRTGTWTLLVRAGPLPGAADWLGQNADAGNTRCSRDRLVMAPLGVLWFGNALSNSLILPRHGEGPVQQVAGGRMFIEGPDSLSAADVYTGRLLWTRDFTALGRLYNVTKHQSGAHTIGSNFFVAADAVYVAAGRACHVLDPASGRTLQQFTLPVRAADKQPSDWQFLLVYEDLLIAGSHPIIEDKLPAPAAVSTSSSSAAASATPVVTRVSSPTASERLVVMDRHSGKVLWSRDAAQSFPHYGICAGGGKVFCIDRMSPEMLKKLARRGVEPKETPRILALEARSGSVVWQTAEHVGTALVYSAPHDILLANAALRGKDGSLVWSNAAAAQAIWYGKWGPMLHDDTILCQGPGAFDLLTGKPRMVASARGEEVPWKYPRGHGCGPKAASQHLITFRSGAAGFFDLQNDGGTGNLGGFRAGCTSNLLVADGVLNAPDYTRTCTCTYDNRSSLALVHMDDVEYWTYGAHPFAGRVGYNFGAPGDRRAADGTLWQATPLLADPQMAEKWPVAVTPPSVKRFYHHASRIRGGDGLPWVAASGLIGLRSAQVPLEGIDTGKPFLLRLVFCEPEHTAPLKRVFSVALEGKEILRDFDVFAHAGGAWRSVVQQFPAVRYSGRKTGASAALQLSFTPKTGEPLLCGIELIQ